MSYSAGFACTKPTYARAEATRRRARLSLRAGKRMSDQPTPRRCPSELSLRQRRLPLPWPSNERLYGGVMRPALAGIVAHSQGCSTTGYLNRYAYWRLAHFQYDCGAAAHRRHDLLRLLPHPARKPHNAQDTPPPCSPSPKRRPCPAPWLPISWRSPRIASPSLKDASKRCAESATAHAQAKMHGKLSAKR